MDKHENPLSWKNLIAGIIITVIGGIILAFLIKDARFAQNPEISARATPVRLWHENGTQKLQQGQMLLLANENGVLLIDFIFGEEEAAYRWRYKKFDSEKQIEGTGKVFERYARTPIGDESFVVDLGSKLDITIEDISIKWSYASEKSGWVYYSNLGVSILDNRAYDELDLSNITFMK